MVTLPTLIPQPCLSSLYVDIQNELRGLSRVQAALAIVPASWAHTASKPSQMPH